MTVFIGLDIGGTKLLVAAADADGNVLRRVQQPTPIAVDEGINLLHEMIEHVAAGETIAGMGAAVGGPLNWRTGVVSPLHQPDWRDVPLKQIMQDRWSCPFQVDVDTNVAALGEWACGGEQVSRLLYITLSTGMGGGYLLDGEIYRGFGGGHPEIAHQAINYRCQHPERIACECGVADCLEALVSGNGIRRIYRKPAEQLDKVERDEVAYNFGQGLRNLAAIYLPDLIVVGGGVAVGFGAEWLKQASTLMAEHLRIVLTPRVRLSALGYETALLGAITIAGAGRDATA